MQDVPNLAELDPASEVEALALYRVAQAIEAWEDMLPPGEIVEELRCFRAYCIGTSAWLRDSVASNEDAQEETLSPAG